MSDPLLRFSRSQTRPGPSESHAGDASRLLEELRVHQVELEMQAQALQESEQRATRQARQYQHLLGEVPVALCRIDRSSTIVSANRAAEKLLGKPEHELIGKLLFRFGFDEESRRRLLHALHQALDVARFESERHLLLCKEQKAWVDLKFSRVPAETGDEAEWIVSLVDQTRVYLDEAELHEALAVNRDLALVADRAPSMIAICDGSERLMWVNPQFSSVSGYELSDCQGQRWFDVLAGPETDASVLAAARQALLGPVTAGRFKLKGYRKSGSDFWLEISLVAVLDAAGAMQRCIFIADDVTQAIKAQADREVLLRSQAMHAVQSDFLSRMSHNMRTPLNAILGFSEVMCLSKEPLLDGQLQKLQLIRASGQQLLQMVNQALALVRLEYQTKTFEVESIDVAAITREAVSMLSERAEEKGLIVDVNLHACFARGNSQLVREIVSNLVSNAIKYSHAGGVVSIACRCRDQGVDVSVRDHGIGIADESRPLLFRPFTRLDNGKAMAPGHGLGLAISQQQALLMSGLIQVESELGAGSTFTLTLPLAEDPAAELPSGKSLALPAALSPVRVVYVEDDAVNRELFRSVLSMYPEVDLQMAETARDGLALIERVQPDVVLLDINLPDGNGIDMCRQLRARPGAHLRLLVALSANVLPEHVAEALQAGFDHYLAKPLQIDRLLHLLATVAAPTAH